MAWTFYDRNGRARTATTTTHPVGSIIAFGGSVAPPGWLICDGAELPKVSYPELSATIGSTYNVNGAAPIGDAINNFRIPDFRGHSPIGAGTPVAGSPGAGASYIEGTKTGERLHALTVGEVPRHTHGPGTLGTDTEAATFTDYVTSGVTVVGNQANITGVSGGNHQHSPAAGTYHTATDSAWNIHSIVPDGAVPGAIDFYRPTSVPYANLLVAGEGGHSHSISQSNHSHSITEPNGGLGHRHTVPAHAHAVTTGATENGTAAGLGAGSPTHNNVGPVLPTNFIIKF